MKEYLKQANLQNNMKLPFIKKDNQNTILQDMLVWKIIRTKETIMQNFS